MVIERANSLSCRVARNGFGDNTKGAFQDVSVHPVEPVHTPKGAPKSKPLESGC